MLTFVVELLIFKGMLVQEYIAEALDSQPPDEWGNEDEWDDMDINDMEDIQ